MRTHKTRTIVWLLIASGALLAAASFAADPPKKSATAALETQIATGMKERGLGAVGPPFKSMEGQWKATQKTWLEAGQPTVTEGTCETKLVSRGRFLERRYKSSLAGQFYEGYGLMGRDERKGTYTLLWGDNRGSGIESYEGTMRQWNDQIAMSTLTLNITTKAPALVAAAEVGLGTRTRSAFSDSVAALETFGEWLLVTATTLLPWMILLVPGFLLGRRAYRRYARRLPAAVAAPRA